MKLPIAILTSLTLSAVAQASIPGLNYSCPGAIEVHVNQGGSVYINGKEAVLKTFNDNYFEAKGGGVTISISRNPDNSIDVSYTGNKGVNGVCQPAEAP